MRVLVINQYFPPDTSATAQLLEDEVAALQEGGHSVTVISGRPSYNPTSRLKWAPLRVEARGGVRILTVGSSAIPRMRMSGRILNYMTFVAMATVVAWFVDADVILVGSDPPYAVIAAALARRGRPVVYRLRDLHPDFSAAAGLVRSRLVVRVWDVLHCWAMRRCEAIVCVGRAMRERVVSKGVSERRVSVIHDGARPPTDRSVDERIVTQIRGSHSFVAVHAGNLGYGVDWESLTAASHLLPQGSKIVFIGGGAEAERVRSAGCEVLPFVPFDKLGSAMAAGDVQIVGQRRGVEVGAVASKLFSVMAHGRPVLVAATEASEPSLIVHESGAGLVVEPDDPEAIAAKLVELKSDSAARRQMGELAEAAFVARFSRSNTARSLVAVVERAGGRVP